MGQGTASKFPYPNYFRDFFLTQAMYVHNGKRRDLVDGDINRAMDSGFQPPVQ
jgi:hypothetical protein